MNKIIPPLTVDKNSPHIKVWATVPRIHIPFDIELYTPEQIEEARLGYERVTEKLRLLHELIDIDVTTEI